MKISQESVTKEMNRLVDYLAKILNYELTPSEFVEVTMVPPVVLILQLIEMTAGSANNIIGVFQTLQLPIDPISFLKKYIPFINWDEFEIQAQRYANEKVADTEIKSKSDARLQSEIMALQQQGQQGGF